MLPILSRRKNKEEDTLMNLVVHSPRLWLGNQATWQKIWKKNGECLRVENERIASVREKQKKHRFDTDPYLERQDEFLK